MMVRAGILRATRRLAAVRRVVRSIIGAPDYDRYVAHMRERHPREVPLSRAEFWRRHLEERYKTPGSRCC
jgi:uncharacterized short protein YbdD (DUF466 family)